MLSESEYLKLDGIAMAELVRRRKVSARELLQTAMARVDRINPDLNAVITRFDASAFAQIDQGLPGGPLSGVPFLLKDLRASYKGVRTSVGNDFLTAIPDFDSIVTQRFRAAGLLMFGKTNVPEMGLSIDTQNKPFGATHNPWKAGRSAGGSSGGSAAAVAARLVPAAHASDGAGSTRVPSAACGVFGLKTSRGRVTYGPDVGDELAGMSTQHACSISVRDNAALLDIDGVPDPGDPYVAPAPPRSYLEAIQTPPRRLRIGMTTISPAGIVADDDAVEAVRKAASLCADMGHSIEEARPDIAWEDGLEDAINCILGVGMATAVRLKSASKGVSVKDSDFLPGIWEFLKIGMAASGADYYLAVRRIHRLSRDMARFHARYDLLLMPSLPTAPKPHAFFDYSESGREDYLRKFWEVTTFMPLANASGQPAMTVPLHWNDEGMPLGVQFVAPYGDEETLLRLAAQLELAAPWADRMPGIAYGNWKAAA